MVNVLIVFAHQLKHKSFNGALKDIAVKELTAQGHNVVVSDLYAQNFRMPSKLDIGKADKDEEREEYYNASTELGNAFKNNTLPEDIAEEVKKIEAADFIIFQFPLHWGGFPAILKSWFDRLWISGFTHTFQENFETGLLKGKNAMLALTTGGPESEFITHDDHKADVNAWLWPLQFGVLRFCGFDVVPAHISYAVHGRSAADREEMLNAWRQRLKGLAEEEPIQFPNMHNLQSQ